MPAEHCDMRLSLVTKQLWLAVCGMLHWAVWYVIRRHSKLTPKGIVFSFFSFLFTAGAAGTAAQTSSLAAPTRLLYLCCAAAVVTSWFWCV